MVRYNLWLHNHQYKFLKKLGDNASEIIRRALDEYIQKKQKEQLNVSTSKGGDINGSIR